MISEAVARYSVYVLAVNLYAAAVYIIEAEQKIYKRGFSAAGRADNGYRLAGRGEEIETVDELPVLVVGEADAVKFDAPLGVVERRAVLVRFLRLLVYKLEYSCRAGKRILKLGNNAGNFVERLCILVRVGEEADKAADCYHAADGEYSAHETDYSVYQIVDKAGRRIGKRREEYGFERIFAQLFVALVKSFNRPVLI